MKICFVLEYYTPYVGGAETLFKGLAETLVKHGHECHVVTCRLSHTHATEVMNGVVIHRVRVPRYDDRYWFSLLAFPTVYRVARSCDVIHTRTYNGAVPALVAAKLLRKPVVITVFEVLGKLWKKVPGMNWLNMRLHALCERWILRLPFDRYVSISHYTRNCLSLLGTADKRSAVIYPGVEANQSTVNRERARSVREQLGLAGHFVYLYFGRPGFFKGVEHLIDAVPLITQKIPQAKLVLILSREPRPQYHQIMSMIEKLQLNMSVILVESLERERLLEYIASSDCVVIPSLTEGFGLSCLEACSLGIPVVATRTGAIPEVIFGRHVLIAPGSTEEICRGVHTVSTGTLVSQSHKVFDWDECGRQHVKLYAAMSNSRRTGKEL